MISILGFLAVYFSIRKPTEEERHGARPPAVRMATFACGGVRGSCARAGAVWGCVGGGERGGGGCGPRGAGPPGRSRRFLSFAEREAPRPFCSFRAPRAAATGRRNQNVQRDGRPALPSSVGAPQRRIPQILQTSDAARIGNRKQRACQRRLVRIGSPVSAACDIHTWFRQRF